jgi:N-acylglucosamine 2-epimerase
MPIDRSRFAELAGFYRSHLVDDVMAFWEARTQDRTCGGYLTMFDWTGVSFGNDKNMWCQGRQLHTFSALYNQLDQHERWFELATCGRDFIVKHGYRGDGSWHYLLDRQGNVRNAAPSLFTDTFVLGGLCEYALAADSNADAALIEATFARIERYIHEPGFNEYHHFDLDGAYQWHAPNLVVLGLAPAARPIIGDARLKPLLDRCLQRVLYVLAKDERQTLFEVVNADGSMLETEQGLKTNPGHAIECLWFCMEEGRYRADETIIQRAAEVAGWSYRLGYDEQFGGLLAFVDPNGHRPPGMETMVKFDEAWDDKIWWVHAEALYCLLLAAVLTDDEAMLARFFDLHEYSKRCFMTTASGHWPCYLDRDGTPQQGAKGTQIRSAFHVPRALMKLVLLLESEAAQSSP